MGRVNVFFNRRTLCTSRLDLANKWTAQPCDIVWCRANGSLHFALAMLFERPLSLPVSLRESTRVVDVCALSCSHRSVLLWTSVFLLAMRSIFAETPAPQVWGPDLGPLSWDEANSHCLRAGMHLPRREDFDRARAATMQWQGVFYWTAETQVNGARTYHLPTGKTFWIIKTGNDFARCIR